MVENEAPEVLERICDERDHDIVFVTPSLPAVPTVDSKFEGRKMKWLGKAIRDDAEVRGSRPYRNTWCMGFTALIRNRQTVQFKIHCKKPEAGVSSLGRCQSQRIL